MHGGESRIDTVISYMLEELFYLADLTQTPHHFVYHFPDNSSRIGKTLNHREQIELLQLLDSKGLIVLGIEWFGENNEKQYTVGLTDKGWSIYGNRDQAVDSSYKYRSAQLVLEDIYLRVVIDNKDHLTLRRFQQDSDAYKLFVYLFNKPIGYKLRLNDVFPAYNNLTKVIKDTKLSYLLPIFFADLGSKEVQLLPAPVEINEDCYKLLLSKSK